jgi:hypothetical protein
MSVGLAKDFEERSRLIEIFSGIYMEGLRKIRTYPGQYM